jgi:hypothetical protein
MIRGGFLSAQDLNVGGVSFDAPRQCPGAFGGRLELSGSRRMMRLRPLVCSIASFSCLGAQQPTGRAGWVDAPRPTVRLGAQGCVSFLAARIPAAAVSRSHM